MSELAQTLADNCDLFALPTDTSTEPCEAPLAKFAVALKEVAGFQRSVNASARVASQKMSNVLEHYSYVQQVRKQDNVAFKKSLSAMNKFTGSTKDSGSTSERLLKSNHLVNGRVAVESRRQCNKKTMELISAMSESASSNVVNVIEAVQIASAGMVDHFEKAGGMHVGLANKDTVLRGKQKSEEISRALQEREQIVDTELASTDELDLALLESKMLYPSPKAGKHFEPEYEKNVGYDDIFRDITLVGDYPADRPNGEQSPSKHQAANTGNLRAWASSQISQRIGRRPKQGWLLRRERKFGVHVWRRIYCFIRGNALVVAVGNGEECIQLIPDLRHSQLLKCAPERYARLYCFDLVTERGTTTFQALGPREMLEWECGLLGAGGGNGPVLL
eukprot:m.85046 g.85046  ORF g.85046 m.85046 type:complete len:391 (+) comp12992_c0_seq1:1573-2745(+)